MDLTAAAAALSEAVTALLAADVGAVPEAELLAVVTGVERCRRRLDAADHVLVAQVESRGVAASRCLPSTAALLRELLTVTPGEAGERVRASADLGPRREVSGAPLEPLEPLYPQTATALAAGDLSSTHARVIRRAVSSLPDVVEKEYGPMVEAVLVEHATTLHPGQLAMLARDVCAVLDPEGALTDEADRERRRDVTITPPTGRHRHAQWHVDAGDDGDLADRPRRPLRPRPGRGRTPGLPQRRATPPRRTARRRLATIAIQRPARHRRGTGRAATHRPRPRPRRAADRCRPGAPRRQDRTRRQTLPVPYRPAHQRSDRAARRVRHRRRHRVLRPRTPPRVSRATPGTGS